MSIRKAIGEFNIKKANKVRENATTRRANTLLTDSKDFMVNEAYKTARTNIIFSLNAVKGCKKIIITSASPAEGKTTTCLNMAIAFAQTSARVLVIDADLRKPRIYRHLGIERENGLSDLLCGMCDVDTAIKHCEAHKIDCITSGQIPPNPAELLSSAEMGALLDSISDRYDYIFIDTPPVTVVTEAAAMAKYASGVILVVRQNNTIHESIKRARNSLLLTDAKILGFILNDIDYSAYGYGRYNKYNYRTARKYGYGGKSYGYGYGKGYGSYGYGSYGYGYGSYGYGYGGYGYGYKERARKNKGEENPAAVNGENPEAMQNQVQQPTMRKPSREEKKAQKAAMKAEMKAQKEQIKKDRIAHKEKAKQAKEAQQEKQKQAKLAQKEKANSKKKSK
ncbi:MAG: polysaccharide biosynthesis tyrosine autokinase [Ruminococcaceae bacterium]|nr:polysaccharide biosynthesis tyrosine autokinase [Oscillospiraceae bacterium]